MPRAATADSVRIYLLTMGPGDDIYEVFGHNAIWVHDPKKLVDTVYNWGVFDFAAPHFILHFLQHSNTYFMWPFTFDETVRQYKELNREVWGQELNLTEPEKQALLDFLQWNSLPQNRPYGYDYYLDNCSTRVRDALDKAVNGQIRAQLQRIQTEETYRSHSLRLMQGLPAIDAGVELLLGQPTDKKLTADEAAFLPVQLMKEATPLKIDGGRPLFKETFVVYKADRSGEPDNVPKLWLWFLPISIVVTALLFWLGSAVSTGEHRRLAATTYSVIAAVFGILGTIIFLLTTITDHWAARWNYNGFMLNPLWLGVAVVAPLMILRPGPRPIATRFLQICGVLSLLAVVAHIGLSHQHNWDAIVLILPAQLAMLWMLTSRRPPIAHTLPDAPRGG